MFAYSTVQRCNTLSPIAPALRPGFYAIDRDPTTGYEQLDGPHMTFAYARYLSDDKTPALTEEQLCEVQRRSDEDEAIWRRMDMWCFMRNMSDYYERVRCWTRYRDEVYNDDTMDYVYR